MFVSGRPPGMHDYVHSSVRNVTVLEAVPVTRVMPSREAVPVTCVMPSCEAVPDM